MNSSARIPAITLTLFAALGVAACGSIEPSPTAPTDTAPPTSIPAPVPSPAASEPGHVQVTIVPNPVPWSGEATAGCSLANMWQYDQILTNTGGTQATISNRIDSFDGAEVSRRSGLEIVIGPGAQTTIGTRWCSSNATEHRAQTTFTGHDDAGNPMTAAGPTVRLQAR